MFKEKIKYRFKECPSMGCCCQECREIKIIYSAKQKPATEDELNHLLFEMTASGFTFLCETSDALVFETEELHCVCRLDHQ